MRSPGRPKVRTEPYERLTARLPTELMAVVREKAEEEGRPLNTQLERIVAQWVKGELARKHRRPGSKQAPGAQGLLLEAP
jgi:hypothetical protein